jgi:homoserine dehydrogenase
VGGGVYKTLTTNGDTIKDRTGYEIEVSKILVLDLNKERGVDVPRELLTQQTEELLADPGIDVFVEVMGGIEPARTVITEALRSGRHVITANKALIAQYGAELLSLAEANGVHLLFEASVAGGIPIIRMLQNYLTANRVREISGILNGTCNYILTEMSKTGREYPEILADAQRLGYAEADPTSDVEGFDAAYKLAILSNLAYEAEVHTEAIERQGITQLTVADLRLAEQSGYTIKLIGNSKEEQGRITLSVRPRLLPTDHPLAGVNDVYNAVNVTADVVGELTFIGRGAGELPTASAVIEDLTLLLSGENAIRRPNWSRCLEEACSKPVQEAGAATGLYLSFDCPDEETQTLLDALLEERITSLGGYVAKALSAPVSGVVKRSYLLGGVSDNLVQETADEIVQTVSQVRLCVILPVEGELRTGVEWTHNTSAHEEKKAYLEAL